MSSEMRLTALETKPSNSTPQKLANLRLRLAAIVPLALVWPPSFSPSFSPSPAVALEVPSLISRLFSSAREGSTEASTSSRSRPKTTCSLWRLLANLAPKTPAALSSTASSAPPPPPH